MLLKKKNILFFTVVLLLSSLFYLGCDDDDDITEPENSGTISLKIGDAPFPIEFVSRAEITVDQVEVRNSGDAEGNFYIASEEEQTYNLIEFRNGVTADLASVNVPEGTYDQVRLRIVDAEIELTSGQTFDLTIPSGASSGLKVFINPGLEVNADVTYEVLLDFDLTKSFVAQGNISTAAGITGFNFKPVIRAINLSAAGSIEGTVTDNSGTAIEGAHIWVEQDSVVTSTYTESNGSYSIIGLPEGIYNVHAEMEGYSSVTVSDVNVESGSDTEINFSLVQ